QADGLADRGAHRREDRPHQAGRAHAVTAPRPAKGSIGSVAIFAASSPLGAWGPWSLASGIGGSEEAVVPMAQHLAALGWEVVVYGNPGDRGGLHNGVEWRDYNPLPAEFDVLVIWRSLEMLDVLRDAGVVARRTYLWMHDLYAPNSFTESRLRW